MHYSLLWYAGAASIPKVSEREWLEQELDPPALMHSESIHKEGSKYKFGPEDAAAWDVMADIDRHLQAADSERPLLPLLEPEYLRDKGTNEGAVTSFVHTITRCLSSSFTAA